jgi:hypothetical protein
MTNHIYVWFVMYMSGINGQNPDMCMTNQRYIWLVICYKWKNQKCVWQTRYMSGLAHTYVKKEVKNQTCSSLVGRQFVFADVRSDAAHMSGFLSTCPVSLYTRRHKRIHVWKTWYESAIFQINTSVMVARVDVGWLDACRLTATRAAIYEKNKTYKWQT